MSEPTRVSNIMTTKPKTVDRKNDTVVAFENTGQTIAAMLENYRLYVRVWFDDDTRQYPYLGSFDQSITGLPSDEGKKREFGDQVLAHFDPLFPVQYVEVGKDYVAVVANGDCERAPQDWSQYTF